jgi:hypothetical protein
MMHNPFRDMVDGMFIPNISVHRRTDNGHYEASALGMKETHHDQATAVNRLTAKLQDGILKGEIQPTATE